MKLSLLSKTFNPGLRILPKETKFLSKSQKLLLYYGLISPSSFGTFTIMPVLQRSLDKLITLINDEMAQIDAQKLTMPVIGKSSLWKRSGRWTIMNNDLYTFVDKESIELCLQPTHEEEVTNLVSSFKPLNSNQMPILFYQITPKFRNETAPKHGLLRCREFLMKDLYSFDANQQLAMLTYNRVLGQYHKILGALGVDFCCVEAHCGGMGGELSHEFHIPSEVGEDVIFHCDKCGKRFNQELCQKFAKDVHGLPSCSDTSCTGSVSPRNAIEVAHCFLLGTRYSKVFDLDYIDNKRRNELLSMGCYGIGVTRLLAACLEVLSEENKIRWPLKVAPYRVAVLLQKEGAHDYPSSQLKTSIFDKLTAGFLSSRLCPSDVLVDDSNVTIGKKLSNADVMGIPWAIVVKNKDVLETVDLYGKHISNVPIDESIATVTGALKPPTQMKSKC